MCFLRAYLVCVKQGKLFEMQCNSKVACINVMWQLGFRYYVVGFLSLKWRHYFFPNFMHQKSCLVVTEFVCLQLLIMKILGHILCK